MWSKEEKRETNEKINKIKTVMEMRERKWKEEKEDMSTKQEIYLYCIEYDHSKPQKYLSLLFQTHSNLSKMQSFSYNEQSLLLRYS